MKPEDRLISHGTVRGRFRGASAAMSGYTLARLFERTLARAWPARHPQIYPALAALETQGLLRVSETGPRRARDERPGRGGRGAVARVRAAASPAAGLVTA